MNSTSGGSSGGASVFYFVGEHSAVDFVNTRLAKDGVPVDLLPDGQALLHWLAEAGLIGAAESEVLRAGLGTPRAWENVLREVRDLRELLEANFRRVTGGKTFGAELVETVNRHLYPDLSRSVVALDKKGFGLVREHVPLTAGAKILALLAARIADYLVHADPKYLRQCAGADCVIYFQDTTKNHRRQWCSMALCGNRHKVAAFRRRKSPAAS